MVVGVLVQIASSNVDKIFDYLVPDKYISSIKIGIRVLVPFDSQKVEGFVLEIKDSSDVSLKEIYDIVDQDIVLNEEMLELGKKLKEETLATLISTYQVMLPKALKAKAGVNVNKKFHTYYKLMDKDYVGSSVPQKKILEKFL